MATPESHLAFNTHSVIYNVIKAVIWFTVDRGHRHMVLLRDGKAPSLALKQRPLFKCAQCDYQLAKHSILLVFLSINWWEYIPSKNYHDSPLAAGWDLICKIVQYSNEIKVYATPICCNKNNNNNHHTEHHHMLCLASHIYWFFKWWRLSVMLRTVALGSYASLVMLQFPDVWACPEVLELLLRR